MVRERVAIAVGLAGVICIGALILKSHGVPFFPAAVVIGVLGQCSWAMLVRCRREWPGAKKALLRAGVKQLRWLRRLYKANSGVAFVAPASMAVLMASALIAWVLSSALVFHTGTWVWVVLLAMMGAVECCQRIHRMMKTAWARAVGRLMLLGLGALVGVVAHVIANHAAHQISQIDPKYCPNFVALMTILLTPLLYVYSVAALVAVWAVLELVVLFVLYAVSQVLHLIAIGFNQSSRLDVAIYRLVYGYRPSARYRKELFEDGQVFTMRTLSMVACVIGILLGLGSLVEGQEARLGWWSRAALVAMDFQSGDRCAVDMKDAYLPLDGDWISVAHHQGRELVFTRTRCAEVLDPGAVLQATAKQSIPRQ